MALTKADVVVNCGDEEVKSKRRYTLSHHHHTNNNNSNSLGGSGGRYNNNKRKRRNDIVLPTKFLLGGNINDPLNLASFSGGIEQVTPESSPLPTPKHKKEVEVLIPVNLSDPLNLNSSDPEAISPIPISKIIRSRKRKRKRTDSETTVDEEVILAGPSGRAIADGSFDKESSKNSTIETDRINGVENNLSESKNDSDIPNKCPRVSSCKKEIDRGDKATSCNRSADDGHLFRKPVKDDEKHATRTPNNQTHHFHHPRSSNSRFLRGQSHSHYFQPNNHRQRQQQQQQQFQHKFRPKDAKFQYGNYNRYYGYRNQNLATDPRLRCFKSEWFEDQDILDIGCNVGHITLTIARDFNPKRILGTDIDENLIKVANRNIKHYVHTHQTFLRRRLDTEVVNKYKCDKSNANESPVDKTIQSKESDDIKTDECAKSTNKDQQKMDSVECSPTEKSPQSAIESLSKFTDEDKTRNNEEQSKNVTDEVVVSQRQVPTVEISSTSSKNKPSLSTNSNDQAKSPTSIVQAGEINLPIDEKVDPETQRENKSSSNLDDSHADQLHLTTSNPPITSSSLKSPLSSSLTSSTTNLNQSHQLSDSTASKSQTDATKEEKTIQSFVINPDKSSTKIKNIFCKPSNFPQNVQFICQNYVPDSDDLLIGEKPEYDCILCLSVTKWVHLNFGDEGLKRVFKRMFAQLKPGGKLILEAQPWCSYKKKKFISESTLNNYWSIKFKPDHFNEYLLSKEVGFSTLELVDIPEHESKGFRRPIFLFRKPKEET